MSWFYATLLNEVEDCPLLCRNDVKNCQEKEKKGCSSQRYWLGPEKEQSIQGRRLEIGVSTGEDGTSSPPGAKAWDTGCCRGIGLKVCSGAIIGL